MRSFLEISNDENTMPTFNGWGYSYKELVGCSKRFVDYSCENKGVVLDIGSGLGWAVVAPCLLAGCKVYINDIEIRHLSIIKKQIPLSLQHMLHQNLGKIQNAEFGENQFDAINISGLLHYFSEEDMLKTIKKMYSWLKENGELFFQTTSIYSNIFQGFHKEYNKRKLRGDSVPGMVDVSEYIDGYKGMMPRFLRLFTQEEIEQIFESYGFKIKESYYIKDRELIVLILKK